MQNATLMSHVDTDLVSREQLALVETPVEIRSFKPVPHTELIDTLEHVLKLNHIAIRKEQFALRGDGLTLFGVLQLQYQDTPDGMAALGLRTSNNRTMSLQICGGAIGVCLRQHGLSRGLNSAKSQTHVRTTPANRDQPCDPQVPGPLREVLTRNMQYQQDLVDQRCNGSEKRLARILLMLAHFDGQGAPETTIQKISHTTLAEMVGTTRSRVCFFMRKFRESRFIYYDHTSKVLKVHRTLLAFCAQ
jgi:Crp-like helix-turn-helix domain